MRGYQDFDTHMSSRYLLKYKFTEIIRGCRLTGVAIHE